MVDFLLIVSIFISFLTTFISLPFWIKQAHLNGLSGKDMHKTDKRAVAEAGGITVLLGAALGILFYVAANVFYFGKSDKLIYIFGLLAVILISAIVGLVDDLLGWKKGLTKTIRLGIVLFAAIPLMVLNAGTGIILLPFFGLVNFGIIYPLILIPLGIVGATTTFNFLAGYNGLEVKQGILILSALAVVTYLRGNPWLSVIALIAVASLVAFYFYNKYPAKVFPGDVMTYSIGALIAGIAILGNVERIALFFFIPYLIEVGLKLRGKLKRESFAKLNEDGSLEMPYEKIYGLEHFAIKFLKRIKPSEKVYEYEVVNLINLFQLLIILIGFIFIL